MSRATTPHRCESPARRSLSGLVVAVAVGLALVASSTRAAPIAGWSLRAGGIATDYERHLANGYLSSISRLDLDAGGGPQVAAELRPVRRFGIEISAARLDLDAHYKVSQYVPISFNPLVLGERTIYEADGTYTLKPLTFAALFHLFPDRKVDVYLGPQVSRVSFAQGFDFGERKPELGYGGKAGVQARFGDGPWGAALEAGYLEIDHDSSDHDLFGNLALTTGSVLVVFHGR